MTSTIRMAALVVGAVAVSACGGAAGNGGGSAASASASVGPAGGTISTGAVTLRVSPGAVSSQTEITVSELPSGEGERRIEIEPRGLALGASATLTVRSDDGNAHDERLVELEHSAMGEVEHALEGEVENEVEHAREAEIHHLGTFEDRPARACTPACDAGLECDDGVCKPHGGGGTGA
jgi:hypothetical protein